MLAASALLGPGAALLAPTCSRLLPYLSQSTAVASQQASAATAGSSSRPGWGGTLLQQSRGMFWSVEREKEHTYKDPAIIINDSEIHASMERTQKAAKDKAAIQAILDAAKERSFLTNYMPGAGCCCCCLMLSVTPHACCTPLKMPLRPWPEGSCKRSRARHGMAGRVDAQIVLIFTPAAMAAAAAAAGKSEYVQGLTLDECATLLNIDVADKDLMDMVYDTGGGVGERGGGWGGGGGA